MLLAQALYLENQLLRSTALDRSHALQEIDIYNYLTLPHRTEIDFVKVTGV